MGKVLFKSNTDLELFEEFIPMNEDFLKVCPDIFDNDRDGHAVLTLNPNYGLFFCDGKPYYYYRHSDLDKTRFVGLIELGDTPFSLQKGGHTSDLAAPNRGDEVIPYQKLSDDPVKYGYSSKDQRMSIEFYTDHATIKEKDIFEIDYTYFPYAEVDHFNAWPDQSVIYQAGSFKGTYMGKEIQGVGRFGKSFNRKEVAHKGFQFKYGNMNNEYAGIREDGRRETAIIDITFGDKVLAYYWLEGEEPVVSNEVEVETVWYPLPYMDDGTCMYKDIIFRFKGKEIHMKGKWGLKGYTAEPRYDKHGQAEVVGTWYEGPVEYKHKLFMSFNEVQEGYIDNLKKLGFEVADKLEEK